VKFGVECNLRQNHFYAANHTETATPSYTLLSLSAGTDVLLHGRKVCSVYLIGDNLTDRAYQNHLSRLKYLDTNSVTGRQGVYNMGRNVCVKLVIPII
jgi:iron complex outermembrane receptor protein